MPYSKKKCVVIGASGFLGRNFGEYFDERGWHYIPIGREAGDLTDLSLCERLFKKLPTVDTVFHFATFQRTGNRQYEIPGDLLAVNARMHMNILDCWKNYAPGAKLVSTGSSCFYPEIQTPIPESAIHGGHLHNAVKYYGLAKELLAFGSESYAKQFGLNYLHCVLATMYGPHGHLEPDRSHFIGGMAARALQEQADGKDTYTVWGSPDTVREVLFARDQIEAILAADQHFENRILNCAANESVTIGQVASVLLDVLGWRARIVHPEDSFRGTSRKTLDSTPFLEKTGWRPKVNLHTGLEILLTSLRGKQTGKAG